MPATCGSISELKTSPTPNNVTPSAFQCIIFYYTCTATVALATRKTDEFLGNVGDTQSEYMSSVHEENSSWGEKIDFP